jgi:hypothetical protein
MNQELVTVVLIGAVVALFVLRPLLRGRARPPSSAAPRSRDARPASSDELAELELDHAMGRVSETDYARWREQMSSVSDIGEPAPSSGSTDATARAEALVAKWRNAPRPRCTTCGQRPEPDARFCSNCGAPLDA